MYVYVDDILKVVDFSLEISCCICQTQRRRVFAERKGTSKSPESTTSPQRTGGLFTGSGSVTKTRLESGKSVDLSLLRYLIFTC